MLIALLTKMSTGFDEMQKTLTELAAKPVVPGTPAAKQAGIELVERGRPNGAIVKSASNDPGI
jgi:hypothetical protein